ncbi:uncharacterized protein [Ptychodera flava]|uniref:uncharacterized protein isoform X2 n=1 Tax=Ptychodera flava TaxID=63121 RepID=UPI00396AAB56
MGTGASKDSQSTSSSETFVRGRQQHEKSHKTESKTSVSDITTTVVKVNVSKSGFWPPAVTIKEGQCVLFIWNEPAGSGHNVRQVVYDGVDLQTAVGGYQSGDLQPQGKYKIQFNLEGEYKFVSDGFHNTTKPFVVTVHSRAEIAAEVTDNGFSPVVIRINQGNTIKWLWNSCEVIHSVYECKLCPKHCGLVRTNNGTSVSSHSGTYKYKFTSPGLYYFQTEGKGDRETHLCVVQVKEIQEEYRVQVTDRNFNPRLLTIQEGDRVWWEWSRLNCRKGHNVIQVSVPQYSDEMDPYPRPVKGGFRCEGPSRSGVLSHVFRKTGVYYYCDHDYDNNREYLGVIIVKPKEKEHFIELTGDGFYPDLAAVSAGDRVWWIWNPTDVEDHFSIMEVDRCVAGDAKTSQDQDCSNMCSYLSSSSASLISGLGVETIQLNAVGVYHYRVSDSPMTVGCSSIIVNPKVRDHTVLITNEGFEPRVSTLNPGDKVWWIWEDCREQQNILQVSHQGRQIREGFCSGAPLDSPGAYVHQFKETGVYYFISVGQPKAFGAIVVSSQQQVARVKVSKSTIQPDPVLAMTNDVVVWMWPGLRKHGITQVADTQQIYELQSYTQDIVTPRRCFSLRFSNPGIYHYYSKAFSGNDSKFLYEHSSKCVLSTVIVNNASDSTTIHVTSSGFKPSTVNILRGQNILWSWKDSGEETHNVVHVYSPDDEKPFTPVTDETAFNSGPPVPNNSFIYTFDEPGCYYVTSQGSPGSVGIVKVLDKDQFKMTAMPVIVSEYNGGTVEKGHTVKLQCNTENSTIFYTIDGSNPEYHSPSTKIYKANKGIILRNSGLLVIRAMATSDDALISNILTTRRYWVLEGENKSDEEEVAISSTSDEEQSTDEDDEDTRTTMKWHWWNCVPELKGWLVEPGCVELYWDLPEEIYKPQVKTYQIYVNNVCYCEALPKDCHSVRVVGLAGGNDYILKVLILPKETHFLPQESNKLTVRIPETIDSGGPMISSEFLEDDNVMAVVWMTVPNTRPQIKSYRLYVNDQKCGDEVIPDDGSNKCKVLIQGCQVNTMYRVQVVAVPKGKRKPVLRSNELTIILPLMNAHIIVPQGRSLLDEDLQGHITVTRGSGQPPDCIQALLPSTELALNLDLEKSNTHTETIVTQANIHLEEKQENQVIEHANSTDEHESDVDSDSSKSRVEVDGEQDTEKATAEEGQPGETDRNGTGETESTSSDKVEIEDNDQTEKAAETVAESDEANKNEAEKDKTSENAAETDTPNENATKTDTANEDEVETDAANENAAETVIANENKAETDTANENAAETVTANENKAETDTANETAAETDAANQNGAETDAANQNEADTDKTKESAPETDKGGKNVEESQTESQDNADTKQEPVTASNGDDGKGSELDGEDSKQEKLDGGTEIAKGVTNEPAEVTASEQTDEAKHDDQTVNELKPSNGDGQIISSEVKEDKDELIETKDQMKTEEDADDDVSSLGSSIGSDTENITISDLTPSDKKSNSTSVSNTAKSDGVANGSTTQKSEIVDVSDTQQVHAENTECDTVHVDHDGNAELETNAVGGDECLETNTMHVSVSVHDDDDDGNADGGDDDGGGAEKEETTDAQVIAHVQTKKKKKKKDKKKKKKREENEIDAVAKAQQEIQELPVPRVDCHDIATRPEIMVEWQSERSRSKKYLLQHYLVCVIGMNFGDVQSHNSFETTDIDGKLCSQHCWIVKEGNQLTITGLAESTQYRVFVSSVFAHKKRSTEKVELKSDQVTCMSGGRPTPPHLTVSSIGVREVVIRWQPGLHHPDLNIKGYSVFINGKTLDEVLLPSTTSSQIQDIEIGSQHQVYVETVPGNGLENSDPSNVITVIAPYPKDPPIISSLPSLKNRAALIGWERPKGSDAKLIGAYRIYVDGKEVGELDVKKAGSKHKQYQYYITDLQPGVSYDVTVRTYTGQKDVDLSKGRVYCGVLSPTSNVLPVMCTAPPRSPRLRLEGLHNGGIDVTWEIPQQYGHAALSGFQLVKDGKLYGPILNPDVLRSTVTNISLGQVVTLQILALTDHPVGRRENDDSFICSSDSGFENISTILHDDTGILSQRTIPDQPAIICLKCRDRSREGPPLMEKYSACRAGPKLTVNYTGLVQPPSKVWCERVTGHSALIAWSTDDCISSFVNFPPPNLYVDDKKRRHYVSAENYQVTWWPGRKPDKGIQSQSTSADHLTIGPLMAATKYTVVVEARRSQMYSTYTEEESVAGEERGANTFILTSRSEQLSVMTGCPPDPPSNIGLITSTCNSLQIAWHSPVEHDVEVIGLRVHVVPTENSKAGLARHMDLVPDITTLTIQDLSESTEYIIHVMAITDEYFDQLPTKSKHKKKSRVLPKDWEKIPKDSLWLPYTSMHATTSGTRPPTDLRCVKSTTDTIVIKWTPPQVIGTNKLQSCIVRWSQIRQNKNDAPIEGSEKVDVHDSTAEITDLTPGRSYRIFIETHILVKTGIDEQLNEDDSKMYRNAQVTSDVIILRTKAPVKPVEVLLTGYSSNHITLYWETPVLFTLLKNKDMHGCGSCIKRSLVGYRLEVNGRTHSRLGPSAQSCTLTKCKAEKKYSIVLVALTTTNDKATKKKRKRSDSITSKQDELNDDVEDCDETPSNSVDIILPKPQPGAMVSLEANFMRNATEENVDENRFGYIDVQWVMQSESNEASSLSESGIQGIDITYSTSDDDKEEIVSLPADATSYAIPIKAERSIYKISVQPDYDDEFFYSESQDIQYPCPGSPDPPVLCCTALQSHSITIEWGEPRLYGGVDVRGYQAFLNEKKIGNVLNSSHRKAVIPCVPQKQYTINMIALSSDETFDDSLPSDNLVVVTPGEYEERDTARSSSTFTSTRSSSSTTRRSISSIFSNDTYSPIQEVNVKISEVTENTISLGWDIRGIDGKEIKYIKVQWSSVANPQVVDTKVAPDETDYIIHRCTSGTNHFIRVFVIGSKDKVLCKSKQFIVQTSAVIATPTLSLSSCTFTHVTIEWSEPKTFGDTTLKGYKVLINDTEEIELPDHQKSYTFTEGEMCGEYKFTLQALCNKENLHSKLSEPLQVTWPGILTPTLRRVPTNKRNTVKVAWNDLYTTGGIKIASFKGICEGECLTTQGKKGTPQRASMQEVGPLHPEARVMEIANLLPNVDYKIYLEISLHGLDTPIRSEATVAQIASVPGPPEVSVAVIGADARRQLDIQTCELINRRDRLLQQLDLYQSSTVLESLTKKPEVQIAKLTSSLIDVETKLLQCMEDLQPYEGTFEVDLKWTQPEDDGDAMVTGYQILINGKPHGNLFNAYVHQTKLKLSAYVPVHRLTMVTTTNHPVGNSEPSEPIPIYSETFLPYSSFCFHSTHAKDTQYPAEGCCLYTDSLAKEMDPECKGSHSIVAVNQGLLKRRVPPAAVTVLDVFEGAWHLLIPSRLRKPTMILFWTKWCLASKIAMKFFVRYSREHGKRISFITCCCASYESMSSHRHSLAETIVENGWRDDRSVRHCCSCHSTTPGLNLNKRSTSTPSMKRRAKLVHQDSSGSESSNGTGVAELFGIQGVPTMLIVNPEGHIAWQGRYAACDYSSFQVFADHMMCETMSETCISDCQICKELANSEIPKFKPLPGNPQHVKVLISAPSTSSEATTGLTSWFDDTSATQDVQSPISSRQGRLRKDKQLSASSRRPYSALSPRTTSESLTKVRLGRPKSSYSQ